LTISSKNWCFRKKSEKNANKNKENGIKLSFIEENRKKDENYL